MANQFLTMPVIASRALATLYNSLVLGGLVYRDFDPLFAGTQGDTVNVRKPAVFQALDFDRASGIVIQDAIESKFPVKLDRIIDTSFAVTAEDLTLKIDDFSARLLVPAMEAIAQRVDGDLAAAAIAAATGGGAPKAGIVVGTNDVVTLVAHGFRVGDPVVFPSLTGGAGLTAGTTYYARDVTPDTFKVSATIGGAPVDVTSAATAGSVADAGGGTVTIDSGQGVSTALINARTALTRAKAPGANRVTIDSPEGTGKLLKDPLFRDADKRGDTDGLIEAAIGRKFGFDSYETNALTGVSQNVAFHRDALALVSRTLALPKGKTGANAATANYKGLGLRVVYDYDINKKQDVVSVDFLCGITAVRPSWAVKVDMS